MNNKKTYCIYFHYCFNAAVDRYYSYSYNPLNLCGISWSKTVYGALYGHPSCSEFPHDRYYPLVMTNVAVENHFFFHGKTQYFYGHVQ